MAYTHLKDRSWYEDVYDRHTVKWARWGMVHYEKFYAELKEKIPKDDTIERPAYGPVLNALLYASRRS